MAEIKLSDGTLVKVSSSVADLREKLAKHDRWVTIETKDGKKMDINPAQVVFARDN